MALSPPSVTQAAPSGPTMTPCGAEPSPSGISVVFPVCGIEPAELACSLRRVPTVPSLAGATSCGWEPAGTEYSRMRSAFADAGARRDPHSPERSRPNTAKRLAPRGRTTRVSPSSTTPPVVSVITLPCVTRTSIVPRSGTRPRRARADRIWRLHAASCSELTVFRSARLIARREKASRAVSRVRQNGLARTLPTRALSRRTPRPMPRASERPCAERLRCVRQSARSTGSSSSLE